MYPLHFVSLHLQLPYSIPSSPSPYSRHVSPFFLSSLLSQPLFTFVTPPTTLLSTLAYLSPITAPNILFPLPSNTIPLPNRPTPFCLLTLQTSSVLQLVYGRNLVPSALSPVSRTRSRLALSGRREAPRRRVAAGVHAPPSARETRRRSLSEREQRLDGHLGGAALPAWAAGQRAHSGAEGGRRGAAAPPCSTNSRHPSRGAPRLFTRAQRGGVLCPPPRCILRPAAVTPHHTPASPPCQQGDAAPAPACL